MSTTQLSAPPPAETPAKTTSAPPKAPRRWVRRAFRILAIAAIIAAAIGGLIWQGRKMYLSVKPIADTQVPTTTVKRADLTMTVSAKGELKGGNSETLTAPMTTGTDLHITSLRKTGDLVKTGDVISLGHALTEPVEIRVHGRTKFFGRPRVSGKGAAMSIERAASVPLLEA